MSGAMLTRISEQAAHGVLVTVDHDPAATEYVIRSSASTSFEARMPAHVDAYRSDVCPLRASECTAEIQGYGGHRAHEMERQAIGMAAKVLKTYGPTGRRHKMSALSHKRCGHGFVPLDGHEEVRVGKIWVPRRADGWRVLCDSPRCFEPINESPYRKPVWQRRSHEPGCTEEAAEVAAQQHRQWHTEQFGTHSRAALDAWIYRHAMVKAPEGALTGTQGVGDATRR